MMVSLDGYSEGSNQELDWHNVDAEFNEFAIEQTKGVDLLLFGRKTYELMANYWPTESAKRNDPIVAELMNSTRTIRHSVPISDLRLLRPQAVLRTWLQVPPT
jgi:dihydrofolate reductase